MSKLSCGPASLHILASTGPSLYPHNFYSTSYSVHHGRHATWPEPQKPASAWRHKGTGYLANFRPVASYGREMDGVDNPTLGKILDGNYCSHTKQEFVPHAVPNGREPLPIRVRPHSSGYVNNLPRTVPTQRQANSVYVNTYNDGSIPVYPRRCPLLHGLRDRDPLTRENARHGPCSMSTEQSSCFPHKPFREEGTNRGSQHSRKEQSGFTLSKPIDPVTYKPDQSYGGELPGHLTWRPTGYSVMRKDFARPPCLKGSEPLPSLCTSANRTNGFVKGNRSNVEFTPTNYEEGGYSLAHQLNPVVYKRYQKSDAAEHSNITHPGHTHSFTQHTYRGLQWPLPSQEQQLSRREAGRKIPSGFVENTIPLIEPSDAIARDSARFRTWYGGQFGTPKYPSRPRESLGGGGGGREKGMFPGHDGFTKSTQMHRFGAPLDTASTLRGQEAYVARSIALRDPCYDDHTHDAKIKKTSLPE